MSLMKLIIAASFVATVVYATEKGQAVKQKASETIDAAADYTKEQKEEIQKSLDKNLTALSKEIDALKKDAKNSSGKAKEEMNLQIANLESTRTELRKDLAKMKKSSGRAWAELKAGTSEAMDKLSESFSKAKKEFNESAAE